MRTALQFRPRTLLIATVVFLTVILVVMAILIGLQRGLFGQPHSYTLYSLDVTPTPPWHPGQTLSLHWVPNGTQSSDSPVPSVTCTLTLYGPYATQAAAQADQQAGLTPSGVPLAASAPLLVLSTRGVVAPAPTPVAYALPDDLAPGYYVVIAASGPGDTGGTSSSWVAEVAA